MEGNGTALTQRGVRRRENLLRAAREVFEERGFLETHVGHITARAGAAYGTFYTYFPSKEAVFFEVAQRLFDDISQHDLILPCDLSAADRIKQVNHAYFRAYLRNARMLAIVEQVATFNEDFRKLRREHRLVVVGRFAKDIARLQDESLVDDRLDPELTAGALAAMVDHTLYLWLIQGESVDGGRLMDTLDALTVRALGLDPWT